LGGKKDKATELLTAHFLNPLRFVEQIGKPGTAASEDKRFSEEFKAWEQEQQEIQKVQEEIEKAGYDTRLSLITSESERRSIENTRRAQEATATIDDLTERERLFNELKSAFDAKSAAELSARNRDRALSLQDEIALLRGEVGGGVGGGAGARFGRQLSRLGVQQGIDVERARREGASPEVLALIAEKQHLEVIKLQQERYTELYNNIADHAGRVWDGMFQKGKNVFQSLADTVKSIWSTAMRKMFSDAVAGLLTPLFAAFSGFAGGGAGAGSAGGGFGGLANLGGLVGGGGGLAGTPPFLPGGGGGFVGRLRSAFGLGGATAPLAAGVGAGATAATTAAGAGSAFNLSEAIMAAPTTAAPALALSGKTAIGFGGHGITFGQLGAFFTNPFTIAAGIGIAATIAFIKLRKNRQDKFREEILRDFAIAVDDKRLLDQIKRIGESAFGRNADKKRFETLRLDPVQSMLMNYAQQTGQSPALLPLYQKFFGGGNAAASRFDPRAGIPAFANGGIVARPTLALVGEKGPEAIVPLNQLSGANITINVFETKNPRETTREVVQQLGRLLGRDIGRRAFRDGLYGV